MFGRKKKSEQPKRNYLACPFCGSTPWAHNGDCAYHNPPHRVVRYECPNGCLQGESYRDAAKAFDTWIYEVARCYDAESVIRRFCEQKKDE